MKKLLLTLVLLGISVPIALAEDASSSELLDDVNLAIEAVDSELVKQPTAAEVADSGAVFGENGLPKTAVEIAIEENSANYECPPYTTYCQQDRQCDAPCGGPGTGACEFGCCYCAF